MRTAAQLYDLARDEETAGRLTRAAALCDTALQRSPSAELRTRILVTLAYLDAEGGDVDGGIARCEEVLSADDHRGTERGRTLAQLGLLRMRSGDAGRALDAFAAALPLLPDADPYLARLYLNRGNVYLQRSTVDPAEHDFALAFEHARRADLDQIAAKALHNRGYVRLLRGDLVGALDDMAAARPTLAPLSPLNLAVCDMDRAEVLLAAGLTEDASEVLRTAGQALGRQRMRQQQGEAELVLARLQLVSGDTRLAQATARSAVRRFEAQGSSTWVLRAQVVVLAAAADLDEHDDTVIVRALQLAEELERAGFREPATRARLIAGLAAIRNGDLESGAELLRRVRITPATSMTNRMLAARVRASLALARGRRSRARHHLQSALDGLAGWQATFGNIDLQAASMVHGRACALLGLDAAVDDGSLPVLLEWSERARSLAGRLPVVRPPRDLEAAGVLTELRALRTSENPDHSRAAELETLVRERLWRTHGGVPSKPVTVDELRSRLAARSGTYLAYFHTRGRLYGLAVTPEQHRLVDLAPLADIARLLDGLSTDLDMVATRTSSSMHRVLVESVRMRLSTLAERVLAPLVDLVDDRPVALSATGVLADVPWPLLPGLRGREVTVTRSATSWVRTPRPDPPTSPGFVAGPDVVRADDEVRRAAAAWTSPQILAGAAAAADAVANLAPHTDLLHVAAHGSHRAQNPLFSAVRLTDGPWFGYDIDHLERVPSIVVLSACELGRSVAGSGREALGMTVAWLHAGARCVIASPAPISDDVACEVLERTHTALARGATPSAALAEGIARNPSEPVPLVCFGTGW